MYVVGLNKLDLCHFNFAFSFDENGDDIVKPDMVSVGKYRMDDITKFESEEEAKEAIEQVKKYDSFIYRADRIDVPTADDLKIYKVWYSLKEV